MSSPDASPYKTMREVDEGLLSCDEDARSGMDPAARQAMSEIDGFQKELDELNEKAREEIIQVENKFKKLRKSFYDKREEVIEKIPNVWVNSIVNHPQLSMLVYEEEEDCLHFLKKVEVVKFDNREDEDGFKIMFFFAENPFFDNLELVKEFKLGPNTLPKSTSTTIKWKEGLDLSQKQVQIIDARKKKGLEQRTFFSWFSDNSDPENDDIAEVFKDDVWANPLEYYLPPDPDMDMEDSDEESMEEDDMIDEKDDQQSSEDNDGVDKGKDGEEEEDDGVSGRKKRKVTGKEEGEGQ